MNIIKPRDKIVDEWPRVSVFAIYDGHSGGACADFLKEKLHRIIINMDCFPRDPAQALTSACLEAEKRYLIKADKQQPMHERAGSCAIVLLIVNDECYIANVGDSRAVMSADSGKKLFLLSRDHKPNEDVEKKRIEAHGGSVY
jgi:protein phosphatase 2C family protein 2/3